MRKSFIVILVLGFACLGENSEKLGKTLGGIFNSGELEKAFEGLGSKLEEIFGGLDKE